MSKNVTQINLMECESIVILLDGKSYRIDPTRFFGILSNLYPGAIKPMSEEEKDGIVHREDPKDGGVNEEGTGKNPKG